MNDAARIYRAEIVRAVLGDRANLVQVADMTRLSQIAEHLAACEEAQTILRAKGHGMAGMSFVEVAATVPDNVRAKLKGLFSLPSGARYPDLGEAGEAWSPS